MASDMDGKRCICKSEIKSAASKQVVNMSTNGIAMVETRPRLHTFTSGNSNNINIIESHDISHKTCKGDTLGGHSFVVKRGRELCRATKAHLKVRCSQSKDFPD